MLLGIITVDDVVNVIREEATEDMLKMAGAPDEGALLHSSIPRSARVRFPWLLSNFLGTLVSGWLLWSFRFTIQEVVALVTFIPVVTAMGGYVGLVDIGPSSHRHSARLSQCLVLDQAGESA